MTRLDYSIEKLREQITEKHTKAIAEAHAEYERKANLSERRDAWRAKQEKRVRAFARNVRNVADNELASFSVPDCPSYASWRNPARERAEAIAKADERFAFSMRRLDSVSAPGGTISLTAKMMSDWFDL